MLAGVEGLAGHLEERVQRAALPGRSLAVLPSMRAVLLLLLLLRCFPLELLLRLLRLLQRWVVQAGMNAVVKRGVMMVMMGEGIRATGIRHGAPAGRGGAAEGRLADGAGHGRERHAHQREVPRSGRVVMVVQVVVRMVLLLLVMMMEVVAVLVTEAGVHCVPGPDNFRLWPVGQDV